MLDGQTTTEIKVLGPLTVVAPDGPRDPGGENPRLLLALLVPDVGRVVTYGRLTEGLWGEAPPITARKTLQVHVSNLRQRLGDAVPIHTSPHGYTLACDTVSVDAVLFEREVDQACSVLDGDPGAACGLFERALDRWNGQAYADLVEHEAIRPEVARLDEIRMRAVECRIEAELAQGHWGEVLADLSVLTAECPYREHLHGLHMVALYRAGRQTEALRHYERTRRILGEELGIDPSRELSELHQRVLDHSPDLDGRGAQPDSRSSVNVEHRGFQLCESLGRRRDGTVYRAVQSSLGRDVAVEVSDSVMTGNPPVLAAMDHPHLVSVIDAWSDQATSYVAMPLLSGTLAQASTDAWTTHEALSLVSQVGRALQHLHDHGVVHSAVHPGNILLDEEGNAFLTDADADPSSGWITDLGSLAILARDLLSRCGSEALPPEVVEVIGGALVGESGGGYARVSAFVDALSGTIHRSPDRPVPATAS